MASASSGPDRRQFPRVEKILPLKLKLEGHGEYDGVSRNISAGGVLFELASRAADLPVLIWPNTQIKVMVQLPDTDQALETRAEITWMKKNGAEPEKGNVELGIRFEGMEEAHKAALTDYLSGQVKKEKRKFIFEKTVYLSDTNMEGNVYFARFFNWQGEAREELFKQYFPLSLLSAGYKLITVNASAEYKAPAFLYEDIIIEVWMANLKRLSIEMVFKMTNKKTQQVVALGRQKIALADPKGDIIEIPGELLAICERLCLDE